MGDKVALASFQKNPIIYETIDFILSMLCRAKLRCWRLYAENYD